MGKTILFIDDSRTMRRAGEIAVNFDNNRYISAESGGEGVEFALQHHPDLIFVDAKLQDQSGYKVCYTLKSNPETHSIPIILMVNQIQPYDEDKGKKVGVDKVIEKPFDTQEIRDIVNSIDEIVAIRLEEEEITQVGKPEIKVELIKPQEDLEEMISPLEEEMISISSLEDMLSSTNDTSENEVVNDFNYDERITSDSLEAEEKIDIDSLDISDELTQTTTINIKESVIEDLNNNFQEERIEEFSIESFNNITQEEPISIIEELSDSFDKEEILQVDSIDTFFEERDEIALEESVEELEPLEEMISLNELEDVLLTNTLENSESTIEINYQSDEEKTESFSSELEDKSEEINDFNMNSFDTSEKIYDIQIVDSINDIGDGNDISIEETIDVDTLESMLNNEEKDISDIGNFEKDEHSDIAFEITSVDELLQGEIEEDIHHIDLKNNEDLKAIDSIIEDSEVIKDENNKVVTSIDDIHFVDDHEQFMGELTPGFDSFESEEKTPEPNNNETDSSFKKNRDDSFDDNKTPDDSFDDSILSENSFETETESDNTLSENSFEVKTEDDNSFDRESVFDKLESLEKIDETHKIENSFDEIVSEVALTEAILESAVSSDEIDVDINLKEDSSIFNNLESSIDDEEELPTLDDFESNETTEELLSNPPQKTIEKTENIVVETDEITKKSPPQQEKRDMDDSKRELVEEKISVKLNEEQMKEVIKEIVKRISKEVIEEIVWQVVPELAETIIREELDRLLNEKLD